MHNIHGKAVTLTKTLVTMYLKDMITGALIFFAVSLFSK